jgi:Domain of unknown function (DUF4157)
MKVSSMLVENDSHADHASIHPRALTRRSTADSEGAIPCAGVQQNAGNFAVQRLFKSGSLQTKLSISQPDDPYEREADRIANAITSTADPMLARKCASCESTGSSCASCAAEPEEPIHRKTESSASTARRSDTANPIPGSGAGEPLNHETRALMEPRFGADLSRVRVHTDSRAAQSARSVNALAYTIGRDIVFGAGQYAPQTSTGQKLLAHELTHFIQQSSAAFQPVLQRACSTDPECAPAEEGEPPGSNVPGSVAHFQSSVEREEKETAKKKHTKTPREIRDELCSKKPPDPACTADGHASRATEFEKLFRPLAPDQFALADGVFIDKAIPKRYAAYVQDCRAFKPKLPGDQCIFIPERLEKQAERYNSGEKKINGKERQEWFADALGTVTHELEHVRFEQDFPETKPRKEACEFDDVSGELTELGAIMSEFPVFFRAQAHKSWHDRRIAMDEWFKRKVTQPSRHGERITGILKAIRCQCECQEVNAYLERLVDFTTKSWTDVERNTFHEELRDPKWKLDWPIQTPPPPRDLPSLLLTPSLSIGYGHLGRGGLALSFSLDAGIPVDRLGKWRLLLGAQARILPQLSVDDQFVYTLGLKFGFLHGKPLGSRGVQYGAFGEIGKGSFQSGSVTEKGAYAAGGVSLRYSPGLQPDRSMIPFISIDVAGGVRFDTAKPELFFAGVNFGGDF